MDTNEIKYLNLGCGNRFIKGWVNIDFKSKDSDVIEFDLKKKLPFPDNSFDFVYNSHVLEHFSKEQGELFIKECYRVLKPNGIIRILVPDLEKIVLEYINNLYKVCEENNSINEANYNWSLIELIDQLVRDYSGGEMGKFWRQDKIINEEYVTKRVGNEFIEYRKNFKKNKKLSIINKFIKSVKIRKSDFTKSGEIHKWMYDRYSLTRLLINNGFLNIQKKDGFESNLKNWLEFQYLDIEENLLRKPDSLIIEGLKNSSFSVVK